MSKLSVDMSASARNDVSRIFHALAQTNNSEIAGQLNIDASTLSRMKNEKKSSV